MQRRARRSFSTPHGRRALLLAPALLLLAGALVGACTAITDPDGYHLGGGGPDAGRRDSGAVLSPDAGPRDGGPIAPDSGPPPPCTHGTTRCARGVVQLCNEGSWAETESCMLGCSEVGGAHCQRFVPSNVPISLFLAGGGEVTLGSGLSEVILDTDACDPGPTARGQIASQGAGAPELCVIVADDIRVRNLTVRGSRPLVLLSTGDVTILDPINLSSSGFAVRGAGGGSGGSSTDAAGGLGAGGRGASSGMYYDGGGGGGAGCGAGGAGGNTVMDGAELPLGGAAGEAYPEASLLSPLIGGAGGGAGASPSSIGSYGGHGGGALQISAAGRIVVRDLILLQGGGGEGSAHMAANTGGGGGGGSGGNLLLESPTGITFQAPGAIYANGGGGGAASECPDIDGEPGQDGQASTARAAGGDRGLACGAIPRGGDGGAGGAGTVIDGESPAAAGPNGGGGGGGAGCVVLRTADGTLPAFTAPISPTPGTAGLRVGMVRLE